MADAKLSIVVAANTKDAEEKLGRLSGSFQNIGKIAAGLAVGAVAGIGAMGAAIGKLALDASKVEQVRTSFENLAQSAGKSADQMMASLREASRGLVSDLDLMQTANEAMLLIGGDVADKLPMFFEIAQASAKATGQDVGFLFDSLVKGIGRASPMILDNLGLTISLGETYEKYAASIGKSATELTKAEQQQALMNAVMESGQGFIERLGETQLSLADRTKQMAVQFENTKTAIGAAFIPVVEQLASAVLPLVQSAMESLVPAAQQLAEWLGNNLPPAIAGVQSAFQPLVSIITGTVIPAISTLVSFIKDNWMPILAGLAAAILTVVVPALVTWGITATATAAATIAALAPVLMPIVAIGAAVAVLAAAWDQNWGGIQDKTQAVVGAIVPLIQEGIGVVIDWWNATLPTIQATTEAVWARIQEVIGTVMAAIQSMIDSTLGIIRGWWEENHGLILQTAQTIWNAIQTVISTVLNVISQAVQTALNAIRAFWDDHGQQIMSIVQSAWNIIKTYIETMLQAILGIIKAIMQLITGDWEGAWETMKGVASTVWEGIKTIVGEAINIVKNVIEIGLTTLQSIWNALWGAVESKVVEIWDGIKAAISTKITEIKTTVETSLNNTLSAIAGMVGAFIQAGKDLVGGLIGGVKAKAQELLDSVVGALRSAWEAATGFLRGRSPSQLFAEMGLDIMLGLAQGIGEGEAEVLERLAGVMDKMGRAMQSAIAGLTALGGYGGIGVATAFGYFVPQMYVLKEDLRVVIQQMSEIADSFAPQLLEKTGKFAEMVGKISGVLKTATEGLTALAEYIGIGVATAFGYFVPQMYVLKEDLRVVVQVMSELADQLFPQWDEAAKAQLEKVQAVAETIGKLFAPLNAALGFLKTLAEAVFPEIENQYAAIENACWSAFDLMRRLANELLPQWDEAAQDQLAKIKEFSETLRAVFDTLGAATDLLTKLADYAPDQAALIQGIELFFANLQSFLSEFHRRATDFAQLASEEGAVIAELIGDTVGSLGQAIQPLLDVAEYTISQAQASVAATLFFTNLEEFLRIFAEKAADFQANVSEETAALAKIIGDTVSGIGNAVEPLINILSYNPEVEDIEARFQEFFYHLERVLWWIEFQKDKWVVSTAAQELAAKISEVMGHLETAVDFLGKMAIYGEEGTTSALTGFLSFLIDLEQVVGAINTARDRITQEALAAAVEFANGCATMLTHITDGVNTLNSLPSLEMDFRWAGYGLGVGFIQGMIDGLINNAEALYQTIMAIVANAIAAANAAAGAASPSREMMYLGMNMALGLEKGLEEGRRKVGLALADLVIPPTIRFAPAMAYPGGAGRAAGAGRGVAGGGAGGGALVIEIPVVLDGREVARIVSKHQAADLRREGNIIT